MLYVFEGVFVILQHLAASLFFILIFSCIIDRWCLYVQFRGVTIYGGMFE